MSDGVGDLKGGLVGVADGEMILGVSVITGVEVGVLEAGSVGMADDAIFPPTTLKNVKNRTTKRIIARIANNRRLSI
jgi:hypothetical protein